MVWGWTGVSRGFISYSTLSACLCCPFVHPQVPESFYVAATASAPTLRPRPPRVSHDQLSCGVLGLVWVGWVWVWAGLTCGWGWGVRVGWRVRGCAASVSAPTHPLSPAPTHEALLVLRQIDVTVGCLLCCSFVCFVCRTLTRHAPAPPCACNDNPGNCSLQTTFASLTAT